MGCISIFGLIYGPYAGYSVAFHLCIARRNSDEMLIVVEPSGLFYEIGVSVLFPIFSFKPINVFLLFYLKRENTRPSGFLMGIRATGPP